MVARGGGRARARARARARGLGLGVADTGEEGRHRLIGTHHACLVAVASPFPIPRHVLQYGADCSGMPEQSPT
jgi:hypothetical protein